MRDLHFHMTMMNASPFLLMYMVVNGASSVRLGECRLE